MPASTLSDRALIVVTGSERVSFLNGLLTNNLGPVESGATVYACLLTPQGKYLFDFFIRAEGESLLLEVDAARRADCLRRLSLYKLRADVTLAAEDGYKVLVGFDEPVPAGGLAFTDPRHPDLGWRGWWPVSEPLPPTEDAEAYHRHRIGLGVPDGSRDLEPDRSILLEFSLDCFNAIDFAKGCYIGQELTARTKYRAVLKRKAQPVRLTGPVPPPGTPILAGEKEAGELRFAVPGLGLALIRLDADPAAELTADGTVVTLMA